MRAGIDEIAQRKPRTPLLQREGGRMAVVHRRRELGAFLRSKRESLRPGDLGIAVTGRRRTPGLRREELALLADVSTPWYTWLEQGRNIHVSSRLLERLADALHLTAVERRHLRSLAEENDHIEAGTAAAIAPSLQRMLDTFEHIPALVFDRCWDIVATNAMARRFSDYSPDGDGIRSNILRGFFLDAERRRQYLDWEIAARRCLMQFRTDFACNGSDSRFTGLVDELIAGSNDFARWWSEDHQVEYRDFTRNFIAERFHPEMGRYVIEQVTLDVGTTGLRVSISSPLPERDSVRRFKTFYATHCVPSVDPARYRAESGAQSEGDHMDAYVRSGRPLR